MPASFLGRYFVSEYPTFTVSTKIPCCSSTLEIFPDITSSDTELSYKRLKVEDAIHASRLALQDGIVAGGGVALLNVSDSLPDTLGGKILKEALKRPIEQICANANIFLEYTRSSNSKGVNAKTGEIVDMFEAQIVDPAKVVKNAVRNAISVASTALTIKIAIPLDRTEEQIAMNFINKQKQW